ncbi:P44/Msp2 family outer membrane protein, partial [Anaplasma marginale]
IKGGKKSNEDTASVFLLGKELAYDTARGQVDRLATALGKMTKSEAKKWGATIENTTGSGDVSQKVCKGTGTGGTNQCGKNTADGNATTKISAVFTEGTEAISSMETATISLQGMANNINSLSKEEKAVVAGAFARAVEGAEVIEVRAIGSTSVMLNAWHCHHSWSSWYHHYTFLVYLVQLKFSAFTHLITRPWRHYLRTLSSCHHLHLLLMHFGAVMKVLPLGISYVEDTSFDCANYRGSTTTSSQVGA